MAREKRFLSVAILSILVAGPATALDGGGTVGGTLVDQRLQMERAARDNPFLLLPHRPNYILPIAYNVSPNPDVTGVEGGGLNNLEAKFQVSLKVMVREGLFGDTGDLYVAYTNQSWWQVYNEEISRPFRETNHEPEIFTFFDTDWEIAGMRASGLVVGLNHQSNGQEVALSRSWNRIFAEIFLERGRTVISFRPWWRIPEHGKSSPDDPAGDDNPDITDYYGNFQLGLLYHGSFNNLTIMLRNNLKSDNHGAVALGWSFPLTSKLKGYLQYFDGYGESLVDYNHSVSRLGVGILLSDWM